MTGPRVEEVKLASRRRRLLALLLSFLVPGGGQALANDLSRGVGLAVASAGVAILAIASLAKIPGSPGILLPIAGAIVWRTWCAWDAYRISGMPRSRPAAGVWSERFSFSSSWPSLSTRRPTRSVAGSLVRAGEFLPDRWVRRSAPETISWPHRCAESRLEGTS